MIVLATSSKYILGGEVVVRLKNWSIHGEPPVWERNLIITTFVPPDVQTVNAVESVKNYNNVELLQDDLDLESKFTETHFDDKVANVLDNLKVMASKRHAFEGYITNAIAKETFEYTYCNLQGELIVVL